MPKFIFTILLLIVVRYFTKYLTKKKDFLILYIIIIAIYLFDKFDFLHSKFVDILLYGIALVLIYFFVPKKHIPK